MTAYDFIIVGAGPAGASLASRLANSSKLPNVLLLEAGGSNKSSSMRILADRFSTLMTSPEANWNYTTAPQASLAGREVAYARGKGLGGSSAINFACWTRGPKDDFDRWSELVGDEAFAWKNAEATYKDIESFDLEAPNTKYANPIAKNHGAAGPVKVEYAKVWEKDLLNVVDACNEYGIGLNDDINSGNPIGMGICPSTAYKSVRWTAASAYLEPAPSNLTIKTGAPIGKVVFDGKKAIGVQTIDGQQYIAAKEVILSAGALDSPKLLMLSGIGPKEQLKHHGIQVVHELPGVGENFQDHCLTALSVQLKDNTNERPFLLSNPASVAAARDLFTKSSSGPLASLYGHVTMAFVKNADLQSTPEFTSLPVEIREHFQKPTIPAWEFVSHTPTFSPAEDITKSYLTVLAINMIPQSKGTVTLRSANPLDGPLADPAFLSHPFDKANMIAAVRHVMSIFETTSLKNDIVGPLHMPNSKSDADIWDFIQTFGSTVWHMSSSVKMGKKEDKMACVDKDFKVMGMEALRVVDVSVCPFLVNAHTVATAYLVGNLAAEKVVREYGLDE